MGNAGIRQAGAQALPDPRVYLQNDFPKFIFQEKIGINYIILYYIHVYECYVVG